MSERLTERASAMLIANEKRARRNAFLAFASVVVALFVAYSLALPASSLSETAYCGNEAHEHGSECYSSVLVCGISSEAAEPEIHSHTDSCYVVEQALACGLGEGASASASAASVGEGEPSSTGASLDNTVTDGEELLESDHVHADACYTQVKTLICGLEEGEAVSGEAGSGETHVHGDACYEQELSCGMGDHAHSVSCYSNPAADVETAEVWEATLPDEDELLGVWADDLITVAESQIGYVESSENYRVTDEGKLKGYTRYGAWYGDAYGDWCAMFVSFCLNYAGVPEDSFLREANCQSWIELLSSEDYQIYYPVGEYAEAAAAAIAAGETECEAAPAGVLEYFDPAEPFEPLPGDIVFFNWDDDADSDHVGIVVEVAEATDDEPAKLKTIEGNASDQVKYCEYELSDASIMGYAALPIKPEGEASAYANYYVWLDGTCGGIMAYYGSDNTKFTVSTSGNSRPGSYTLPTTWTSPTKYDYELAGWYDVKNSTYYAPGVTVSVSSNLVFYADWQAKSYDIGIYDEGNMADAIDTGDFISTDVFDYGALFDVQSWNVTVNASGSTHKETWTPVSSGTVSYGNKTTLGFGFIDWHESGDIASANTSNDGYNKNKGEITTGVIAHSDELTGGSLISTLFGKDPGVIGKTYVGTGNYLYQYMDEGSGNYDGVHDGYYYYDSTKNAASYNQSEGRFYVYDYLERTSDSLKDGMKTTPHSVGAYSDFLPFNSPYIFADTSSSQKLLRYNDSGVVGTGDDYGNYQYDAKSTSEGSAAANAGTNYWFGMHSAVSFYLPNSSGMKDASGQYGNRSTTGEEMEFEFSGDDDVWIYVDDTLVLDVGGVHGVEGGSINFSTGVVTTFVDGERGTSASTQTFEFSEGDHVLHLYYLERGGSQSNCRIYFNLAPRYSLELSKQDADTGEALDGAKFGVYMDEDCSEPAQLWASEAEYKAGAAAASEFEVVGGKMSCWGMAAGHTYYIRENQAPDGSQYEGAAGGVLAVPLVGSGSGFDSASVVSGSRIGVNSFAVDATGQQVSLIVTNTAEAAYVLPETGGVGRLPFAAGGFALLTAAFVLLLRRRRGGNDYG